MIDEWLSRLPSWAHGALDFLKEFWDFLKETVERYTEERASEAAASMAYYTFFSLFPLMLALVAAGSIVLQRQAVYKDVINTVAQVIPVSQGVLSENLDRVLALRGPVGIIGLIGLIWAAAGAFSSLILNINRAWKTTQSRGFIRQRLFGMSVVMVLAALLALSGIAGTALSVLREVNLQIPSQFSLLTQFVASLWSRLVPWLIKAVALVVLYLWAPNKRVTFRAALLGGMVAAAGLELGTTAFSWYLTSGLVSYELIYGSLGTVVVIMLYLYLSSVVILFGAHMTAVLDKSME
ncbi:MAG: YihY/virulence factor BrkB family protein [Anaerolineales bacterium]|jgi:membrane protein